MNTPTPTICIYHGNCADGFGAAWVVRKALGREVEFVPGIYGKEPPDVTGKNVILVDFSYKYDVLAALSRQANTVIVLDHHKTAAADLSRFEQFHAGVELDGSGLLGYRDAFAMANSQNGPSIACCFDMNRSGAMLAWDHFFPNQEPPQLLRHIEDRDLWLFKLDGTREIQANLFSYPYDFEVWDQLMAADVQTLRSDGAAIERKHHKDIAELVAVTKRRMVIGGHDVPAASLPYTLTSDAGHLMAHGEPFAACYWDTPDGRSFSLRSRDDGADVSAIAAQYGGGGHRNASGFRVPVDHPLANSSTQTAADETLQQLNNLAWLLAEGVLVLKDDNPDAADWFNQVEVALNGLPLPPPDPAGAAIQFALEDDDGMDFLRLWNEGEFDYIRSSWPNAPEEVFIGADPLYRKKDDEPEVTQ